MNVSEWAWMLILSSKALLSFEMGHISHVYSKGATDCMHVHAHSPTVTQTQLSHVKHCLRELRLIYSLPKTEQTHPNHSHNPTHPDIHKTQLPATFIHKYNYTKLQVVIVALLSNS